MSAIRGKLPPQGMPAGLQITSGTIAAIPTAGVVDRYYWATDITTMFRDTGAAWEVVGAQWYHRYITTVWGGGDEAFNTPNNVGRVYYQPIKIPRTLTIDRLGNAFQAAAGNEQVYYALYDSVNEAPVNRLAVSASTAVGAVFGKLQLAIVPATLQLNPGYYFLAWIVDTVTVSWRSLPDTMRPPANILHGPSWYHEDLGAYAIPPAVATPVFVNQYAKFFWGFVRVSSIP